MHHDSLQNLAVGYFERLEEHVRIVHGLGLQVRADVFRHRKRPVKKDALYTFRGLGDMLGITVREGRKLLEDLQRTLDANRWGGASRRWDRAADLAPIFGRMIALRQDLCPACQAKEPLTLRAAGTWQQRALFLLSEAWGHAQRAQFYMEFNRRKLNERKWASDPAYEDVFRSVNSTLSLLTQELECLTAPFNAYSFYVEGRTITVEEYRPRVCIPALELASEYVLERELCPACEAAISPPPPFPIY